MIPVIITRITDDNACKIAMTIDMVIYLLFFLQNTQGLDNNAGNDYSKIGKCRLYISLQLYVTCLQERRCRYDQIRSGQTEGSAGGDEEFDTGLSVSDTGYGGRDETCGQHDGESSEEDRKSDKDNIGAAESHKHISEIRDQLSNFAERSRALDCSIGEAEQRERESEECIARTKEAEIMREQLTEHIDTVRRNKRHMHI